ncbi:hypothetical protein HBB16_03535, partial [Pseudonocardia sp. MCCB 268]|nr:hypothetical protein [Pseudonocardia cytotoxica]
MGITVHRHRSAVRRTRDRSPRSSSASGVPVRRRAPLGWTRPSRAASTVLGSHHYLDHERLGADPSDRLCLGPRPGRSRRSRPLDREKGYPCQDTASRWPPMCSPGLRGDRTRSTDRCPDRRLVAPAPPHPAAGRCRAPGRGTRTAATAPPSRHCLRRAFAAVVLTSQDGEVLADAEETTAATTIRRLHRAHPVVGTGADGSPSATSASVSFAQYTVATPARCGAASLARTPTSPRSARRRRSPRRSGAVDSVCSRLFNPVRGTKRH